MTSVTKIIKASAIGVFCGAAYLYFSKDSSSQIPNNKNISGKRINVRNELPHDVKLIITEKLSNIDDLSKQIWAEINFKDSSEFLRKSLRNWLNNNNMNFKKTVEDSLNNLSVRTKNANFLNKFISLNGLSLLKDLLTYSGFDFCLNETVNKTLSEILSNISQKKESIELMNCKNIDELLNSWYNVNDIVLNLNVVKVLSNISSLQDSNSNQFTIYSPDIFLLDHEQNISRIKDYDIVFINGMMGSVYFTWRQYDNEIETDDHEKTKCWPRDWLSPALPKARVIGINALLKPFVWNPMSNFDKINRAIEDRASDIIEKLEMAGVGKRPILWVTHSAGGILLKHMLHITERTPLATATKAIMFMSTPHSGAQSMLGLYYFPFKYFLTPEAKHLETNSEILLQLDRWFKDYVKEQNVEILTLIETEPTRINKFYSTIIVPKCDGDLDGHQQLEVKSNHLYISKPKNQSDQIYVALLEFVKETMEKKL